MHRQEMRPLRHGGKRCVPYVRDASLVCESSQFLVSVCMAYDLYNIVTLIMAIDLYEGIMHHLNVLNVLNVSNNDGV